MKVVILAGGKGTRITEESQFKPKPMIQIGEYPIIWHIMKIYSHYGHNDFIICAGYKKEHFIYYFQKFADEKIFFDKPFVAHLPSGENWNIIIADTGEDTLTGGRVKRISKYIDNEPFMLTYGDGVADVNIDNLLNFYNKHNRKLCITAIQPESRYGVLEFDEDDNVLSFKEKDKKNVGWINGGYMIVDPLIFDFIEGDNTIFERYPIEKMVSINEVVGFKHDGFWQCMDTLREKQKLELLWEEEKAPWKVWKN